ncbi:hypothetical protein DRO22_03750 [Candidatus Bathyarchaeota archaeon]|nr:MAG: hypothetical protein DRO22_03750 [Candidatus Bathyarchaeota archaeon]
MPSVYIAQATRLEGSPGSDSMKSEETWIAFDRAEDFELEVPVVGVLTRERISNRLCWSLSNDLLGVYGVGETLEEAEEQFERSLYAAISIFCTCPEGELSPSALRLRRELEEHLHGVGERWFVPLLLSFTQKLFRVVCGQDRGHKPS